MPVRPKFLREPSPEARRETVVFALLFLFAFLPYANTLFNGFVYDDHFQVVNNPYVHSFRYLSQIFTTTVWSFQGAQGVSNYFRPMMSFGYLLAHQVAGSVPFSYHLANLILNGFVVWLVFCLIRRFSGEHVALVAAGLFAFHPIHTEAVAWIAAVTDLELSVFYLATFLLYLMLAKGDHRLRARALMCASFALALLSKEQAMTLPVLATLFEHFYRDDRSTTTPREKFSRYGPLWGMVALYLFVRILILGGVASVVSRPNLSWYETGLSAISLIGGYLGKLIWPVHLSAFYVFSTSRHLADAGVLLGLAGLALCAIFFAVLWKRAHILSFAFLWMFLTLAPVLNARWMPASVFAERYLYLPSVGFCWLLGWGAIKLYSADVPGRRRPLARAVPIALAVVAILYAARTVRRNRVWRTDQTLFQQTLRSQGNASLIRASLGAVFFDEGRFADAEREWLQSLSIAPNNAVALNNMAVFRRQQKRYTESMDYSWRALRARPAFTSAHTNLAETLALLNRNAEAEWQFRIATTLSPLSISAHNDYGKFLLAAGRSEDAREEYERSASADANTEAFDRLGNIYLAWRDFSRAEHAFRSAIAMDRFESDAHIGLGEALESTNHPAQALHEYDLGLEMDPANPLAKAAAARLRANSSSNEKTPPKNPPAPAAK
ncbi:MAG TPA: tetratricopeptide repeat protein [Candidatus Dormibacteraeota bacterium]|nr:tetratricopeptide repeat protein [Candidatus Dormibacteraeota bacterium]